MTEEATNDTMVVGIDLAVSHTGLVLMNMAGAVVDWRLIVGKKKYVKVDKERVILIRPRRTGKKDPEDRGNYEAWRRAEMALRVNFFVLKPLSPLKMVNIEHYAHMKNSRSTTGLAEIGGIARNKMYDQGTPYRETDPKTLKKFATGNGNASKQDMVLSARDMWVTASPLAAESPLLEWDAAKKDSAGPATDLADAFWLAELLRMELRLRAGTAELRDLPSHQRQIFLRVTDANPVNLLDRPFIQRAKEK